MFGPDQWYYIAGQVTIGFLWFVSVYWLWKMIKGHFKMQRDLAEKRRVEEEAAAGTKSDIRRRSKKVE